MNFITSYARNCVKFLKCMGNEHSRFRSWIGKMAVNPQNASLLNGASKVLLKCGVFLPTMTLATTEAMYEVPVSDIEDNITHLIILSRIALERGDMEKAEALLIMGLKICDDYRLSYGIPYIYDILTSIAFASGDNDKAELLLMTGIEKMIHDGVSDDDDNVVEFKLRLSRLYSAEGDTALAEIGFKTCLNTQERKLSSGDISTRTGMLYVNVLFWYGVHMMKSAQYGEAKRMIETAHSYSNVIKGLTPYQEMLVLYTLADLNLELGEYDVALSSAQTAVMLGKGISSSDLPKCYVKLARIYQKMGMNELARVSAEEGAKLARIFGKFEVENDAKMLLLEIAMSSK